LKIRPASNLKWRIKTKTNSIMSLIRFKQSALPGLVDNFFHRDASELLGALSPTILPSVNVLEKADGFVLELAAPGLKKELFQIQARQNQLTIGYEAAEESEVPEGRYTRREFRSGSFKRTFSLPQIVDGEKITAAYIDGVLFVQLPKKEEARTSSERNIEIA
jgi:HSP20 family protein